MRCHLNSEGYVCRGGSWRDHVQMASKRFRVESMVREYHVYKDVWEAAVGEEQVA